MKHIPRYEGLYAATEHGEIYSFKTNKILKPRPLKNGYQRVNLSDVNGALKDLLIHRLVCAAYHGESDLQVNHKDGNKANNKPDNLEWCTPKENMAHASKTGRMQVHSKRMRLMNKERCAEPVLAKDDDGEICALFPSMAAAEKFGFCHSQVSRCAAGKRHRYKGFDWEKA